MIRARVLIPEPTSELELTFARLGLPRTAREYLQEKVVPLQLLLTGLGRPEGVFLRDSYAQCQSLGHEDFPLYVSGDQQRRRGSGLLLGRRDQMDRLLAAARLAGLDALAQALSQALEARRVPEALVLRGRAWEFGRRPYLMGVVNVTPDSFSDGGRFLDPAAAVRQGLSLVEAGADWLDVGGESTRPGAAPVTADDELERVLPVIQALRARTEVPISVDTTKAAVAREALAAGADLVNDISGFQFDPELPAVVANAGAACCLMHIQGTPRTMQQAPHYQDLTDEVLAFLEEAVARGTAAGVPRGRILVDPGIGFGKAVGHNLYLLRRLHELRALGLPILVGTSRKSFLGRLLGERPVDQRLIGTVTTVAVMAVGAGADVIRVHDASAAREAVLVASAIRQASEGGDLFLPPSAPPSA